MNYVSTAALTAIDPEKELEVARVLARADLYYFSRYMFFKRRGFKWHRAKQHKIICDALMRVYRGECKRLIINVAPRYSKTELAVVNFIAWCIGLNPDCEFIHTSYSARLASNNSWNAREIVQSPEYHQLFPNVSLRDDSSAKDEWKTNQGGVVYSVGAEGTITGYGAGKMRPGFGGCFPYEELVDTEHGPIQIGDIVTKKINVRVPSFNSSTGEMELQPIDTLWTNPANDILEVQLDDGKSFRCTPNHKILTSTGWIEAQNLTTSMLLPNVADLPLLEPTVGHGLRNGALAVSSNRNDGGTMFGLSLPRGIGQVFGNSAPRFAQLDLANHAGNNAVLFGKGGSADLALEDGNHLFAVQLRAGAIFQNWKRAVADSILHVVGLCSPRKVVDAVVQRVTIEVPRFIGRGPVSSEGFKHHVRDVARGDTAIDGQIDTQIPVTIGASLEHARGLSASDAAPVGDFINPLGSRYRKPVLIRRVGHVDVTYCLEVRNNNNFVLSQSKAIVSNCIIVDDPHKPGEILSETVRPKVIEWFKNTLESRKNSGDTPIILIMQRLHEEDLAGWLLAGGNGEKWEHVNIPAIQDDGTALWPEKHTLEDLRRMEESSPWTFSSQYMQNPVPPEGGIFRPDSIEIIDKLPKLRLLTRAWDLAATQSDGDYTAGLLMGQTYDNRHVIVDARRLQGSPDKVEAAIVNTAKQDGPMARVSLPQDPGQAGKAQVAYLTRALSGFRVFSSPETGDKVTRAQPFASQVNVGNVQMLRGEWNAPLIHELRNFPFAKYDDQVDASSRAFNTISDSSTYDSSMAWVGA